VPASRLRVGPCTRLARSVDRMSAHLFAKSCTGGQYPDWSEDHAQTEKGLEAEEYIQVEFMEKVKLQ